MTARLNMLAGRRQKQSLLAVEAAEEAMMGFA
jgi:hypothetical protein